jgi:hypothetical protein
MTNFLGNNAASYYIKSKIFCILFLFENMGELLYSLNPDPDLDPEPDLEPKLFQSWS